MQIATRGAGGDEHVFIIDLLALLPKYSEAVDAALAWSFQSLSVLKVCYY